MTGRPIDVLLVEDNEIFRETLELLIDVTSDMRVVAAVGDGPAALEACARLEPQIVLMDYRLPGLDGVETTAGIRSACPRAAVIVLTAAAEPGEIEALLEAGAVACMTKDRELDEIIGAIRTAAGRDPALQADV